MPQDRGRAGVFLTRVAKGGRILVQVHTGSGVHMGSGFSSQTLGSPHQPWVILMGPGFAHSPEF